MPCSPHLDLTLDITQQSNSNYHTRNKDIIFIYFEQIYFTNFTFVNDFHWILWIATERSNDDSSVVRHLNLDVSFSWPNSLGVAGVRICFIVPVHYSRTSPITDSDLIAYVLEWWILGISGCTDISGSVMLQTPLSKRIPFLVNFLITDIISSGTMVIWSPLLHFTRKVSGSQQHLRQPIENVLVSCNLKKKHIYTVFFK